MKSNKSKKKKLCEIAFCGSFKFFPSSKIDFWPFLKLQKMEFGQKKFPWNWIIWFHEFLAWTGPIIRSEELFKKKSSFWHYLSIFSPFCPLRKTIVLESKNHDFSSLKKLIHITPHFTVVNTYICVSATSLLLTNKKRGFIRRYDVL